MKCVCFLNISYLRKELIIDKLCSKFYILFYAKFNLINIDMYRSVSLIFIYDDF